MESFFLGASRITATLLATSRKLKKQLGISGFEEATLQNFFF
jgi:hypothetical protein